MRLRSWKRILRALYTHRDFFSLAHIFMARRRYQSRPGFRVTLHPRALSGTAIYCRTGTTDWPTFFSCFVEQFHVPPNGVVPTTVLDLGANVGYTVAHFAALFPSAQIFAVEMEDGNYQTALANTAPWKDRVRLFRAAVSTSDGEAFFAGNAEDAYRLVNSSSPEPSAVPTKTITVPSLLRMYELESVDLVKMDIEGAEKAILLEADITWLNRVNAIQLEIHDKALIHRYTDVLERSDFVVKAHPYHWSALFAYRPSIFTDVK